MNELLFFCLSKHTPSMHMRALMKVQGFIVVTCMQLLSSGETWAAYGKLLDQLLLVCDVSKVRPVIAMSCT